MRWSVEVTFEESRRHIGIETQRQWTDLAIARTTPALMEFLWMDEERNPVMGQGLIQTRRKIMRVLNNPTPIADRMRHMLAYAA